METYLFGYVGLAAHIEPSKRSTQFARQVGPSNVMRFGSDQKGISHYMMFVEEAEEEEFTMDKSISGNVRPTPYIGPPKRLA